MFVVLHSSLFRLLVASEGFFITVCIFSQSPHGSQVAVSVWRFWRENLGRGTWPGVAVEFNLPNGADAGFEPQYGRTASNGALERLESRFDAVFHFVWNML